MIRLFLVTMKRFVLMSMAAIMLGISNIVFEEERSVNDTRLKIEVMENIDRDTNFD